MEPSLLSNQPSAIFRGWGTVKPTPDRHPTCAALLFIVLALMCLKLFTQTDAANPTPRKLRRNKRYVVCGYTIFACIALIGSHSLLEHFYSSLAARLDCYNPVFWLESGSVLAFAIAWLVKGETFSFIRD